MKLRKARKEAKEANLPGPVRMRIAFSTEKSEGNGEDANCWSENETGVLAGVFDGCGGAGARRCPKYGGRSEAFLASRAAAVLTKWFFEKGGFRRQDAGEFFQQKLEQFFFRIKELYGEDVRILGSMSKLLPTTLAAAVTAQQDGQIFADLYWAGDSRVYLLDKDGLAQLTEDDLEAGDAFENLTDDSPMTNMVQLSQPFTIHQARLPVTGPCFLFAATDGCFGYLSTPMEFEYLLLYELMKAKTPEEWEARLIGRLGQIAADDCSISGTVIGFRDFSSLQAGLYPRARQLYAGCIRLLKGAGREQRAALWQDYRDNYYRFLQHAGSDRQNNN